MTAYLKMLVALWLFSNLMSPAFALICPSDEMGDVETVLKQAETRANPEQILQSLSDSQLENLTKFNRDVFEEISSFYGETASLSFDPKAFPKIKEIQSQLKSIWESDLSLASHEDSEILFDFIWQNALKDFRHSKVAEWLHQQIGLPNFNFQKAKELYLQYFETEEDFQAFYDERFEEKKLQLSTAILDLALETRYTASASEIEGFDAETHGSSLGFLLQEERARIEGEVRSQFEQKFDSAEFNPLGFKDKAFANPMIFLGGEVRFRDGRWQRKTSAQKLINSPNNFDGRTREVTIWQDISESEFKQLEETAIQRRIETELASSFIFKDHEELQSFRKQLEELRLSDPTLPAFTAETLEAEWKKILLGFETQREVERLRFLLEDDFFRKEDGRLDYMAIEAHPGYTAMQFARFDPHHTEAAFPSGMAGLESAHIIHSSSSSKEILDNLSLVARRDRAYANLGLQRGFDQRAIRFLTLMSERQNRANGKLILKPEDIDIDEFLRENPEIDQLRALNESISRRPPRIEFFTKEGLRSFIFEKFKMTQMNEAQQIESEIARLLENQSWKTKENPFARSASPRSFALSPSNESQTPEDQLRDLMKQKQQRLDYLKQVLEPEVYAQLEASLSSINPSLQAAHRIHRPEFSGAVTPSNFESTRLESILNHLEEIGFYNENETDSRKLEIQNEFIRRLQLKPNPLSPPASLAKIDEHFRPLFSHLSREEQNRAIEDLHQDSKNLFLNRTHSTLFDLEFTMQVMELQPSRYRMNQQKNLDYLKARKSEIYESLKAHFSQEELAQLRRQVASEVSQTIRGFVRGEAQQPETESGGLSGFARDVGRSFADSALDMGEKLAMGVYGLGYTAAYPARAAYAAMTDQQIDGFYDGMAYQLEGIQRISNEHPLRGRFSSGSFLNDVQDRSLPGLAAELAFGYGLFYYAPIFSVAAGPLFESPELLTRNLIYRQAMGLSDQELHELRTNNDATVALIDGAAAATQATIGLGLMLGGRPSQAARGRQILQNGIYTPSWLGRVQLMAPRLGRISDRQALWAGRAATVGTSVGVAAGLSAFTVGMFEAYHSSLEGRNFNVQRAIQDAITSTGTSLLYMGLIRQASGWLASRHYGGKLPNDPSQLRSLAERTMYSEAQVRAQAFAFWIDVVEGLGEMPQIVEMLTEAYESGSPGRFWAALGAATATLYDSFGEQLTVQRVRDGTFKIYRPFLQNGEPQVISVPIFAPQGGENQAEYSRLREERLSALYNESSKPTYSLSAIQIREILTATEETREILYAFQARDYQPASAASFDITQVYEASVLEQAKNQLLERYQIVGLTPTQAQQLIEFALSNHLLDDYMTPNKK